MTQQTFSPEGVQATTAKWPVFRMRPSFVIIGAQKAGTTSFYHLLCQHPSIRSAKKKELHYFDLNYGRGVGWYASRFPFTLSRLFGRGSNPENITGEASPYYMFHPLAIPRLAQVLPDAKLIVLLRNPVERAYSHYNHEIKNRTETLSFEAALESEQERLRGESEKIVQDGNYRSLRHRNFSYLARGIYADQLEAVFQVFDRKQVMILESDTYFKRPAEVLRQTCSFLQVPEWRPQTFPKLNEGSYAEMKEATRQFLENYYQAHNQRLFHLLDRTFAW